MDPNNMMTPSEGSGSKKVIYVIVGLVVLALVGWFLLKGVGKSITGVDIDRNLDGSTTYTGKGGVEVNVKAGSLPDNWPSDAPKYPNANIEYAMSADLPGGGEAINITFSTQDSVEKVAAYYKGELPDSGWTVKSTQSSAGSQIVVAAKGERAFSIFAQSKSDGKTLVTVSVSAE